MHLIFYLYRYGRKRDTTRIAASHFCLVTIVVVLLRVESLAVVRHYTFVVLSGLRQQCTLNWITGVYTRLYCRARSEYVSTNSCLN